MFSADIVDSDAFLDMPSSSQALYFHLAMRADDDGFVNPKKIIRVVGVSDDDLKVLLAKRFLLPFESGVVVIKHWLIHNMIRRDRYKETVYLEEKILIQVKENGSYTEVSKSGLPNGNQMATQYRLGKDRLGKDREEEVDSAPAQTFEEEIKSKSETWREFVKELASRDYISPVKIHNIAIEEFCPYWLEKSPSGKKLRFQKERVFDYKLRFRTWLRNYHSHLKDYRCKADKWHTKGDSCYCVKTDIVRTGPLMPQISKEIKDLAASKKV